MENNRIRPRLSSRRDYDRIREKGRTLRIDKWLIISYLSTSLGQTRLGWTVPRYVGTAVVRNRLKRWLRLALAACKAEREIDSVDINFVFLNRGSIFYKEISHENFDRAIYGAIKKFKTVQFSHA